MKEIWLINPSKRGGKMPKKKRKAGKPRRKNYRRNPSKAKSRAKRAVGAARSLFSGISIKNAIKIQIPMQIGGLAARFASKRGGPAASDYDPATWNAYSYAKGFLGAVVAGVIAQQVARGSGQKVLDGGIYEITRRLLRNEVIQRSTWAQNAFGEDEGDFEEEEEGLYLDESGVPYMEAMGGAMPLDERHRLMGDLQPVTELGQLEPVTSLGGADDFDSYSRAYGPR